MNKSNLLILFMIVAIAGAGVFLLDRNRENRQAAKTDCDREQVVLALIERIERLEGLEEPAIPSYSS